MRLPRTLRRLLACEAGNAVVELGFVLPAFMLLLYGIVELSHYGYTKVALADAAREGVRYAMVRGAASGTPATTDSIRTYVRGRIALLDPSDVTVTPSFAPNNKPGSTVTVSVSYPFVPFLPGYSYLVAATLTDSARMTIAQ